MSVVVCCGEELALVYHFKVGSAGSISINYLGSTKSVGSG